MNDNGFEFRGSLGRALRVGGIDYLNSRPLIECMSEVAGREVDLRLHPPSDLARRLRSRELDVALVPVVEYFLAPCRADYRVVPGISIASCGAVESIRLYFRAPLGDARRVALDKTSMTSQLLTRLLFAERPREIWRFTSHPALAPEFEIADQRGIVRALEGDSPVREAPDFDAALLIGDAALEVAPVSGWRYLDLGLEWTRWLGLPFVFAVWVMHGEPPPRLTECLSRVRDRGFANLDAIADGPLPPGMKRADCLRYLGRVLRFGLGDAELTGLREFVRRVARQGWISSPEALSGAIRFVDSFRLPTATATDV